MANLNPSPTTRFVKGNPGRTKGSRNFNTMARGAILRLALNNEPIARDLSFKRVLELGLKEGNSATMRLIWHYLDGPPRNELRPRQMAPKQSFVIRSIQYGSEEYEKLQNEDNESEDLS
jgi:hypothetical protein